MNSLDIAERGLSPRRTAVRSSLACLPCRSRHVKCDGKKPQCKRCLDDATECHYAKSRRGGLDRAALAERRKKLAEAQNNLPSSTDVAIHQVTGHETRSVIQDPELPNRVLSLNFVAEDGEHSFESAKASSESNSATNGQIVSGSSSEPGYSIASDPWIQSYYKLFHRLHPMVLPRQALFRLYNDPDQRFRLGLLIPVLRLIGFVCSSREWSFPLENTVQECLSQVQALDPFTVQSRLLYSVALFWSSFEIEGKQQMNRALDSAIDIGMFRREFAAENSAGDATMMESWRRTWWTTYVLDGYFGGTNGCFNFTLLDIDITVDLPCEEMEYESGNIPTPKTLKEFDQREFDLDAVPFSSFAYLVGAARCSISALYTCVGNPKGEASSHIIQTADSILDGWLLLLPRDRDTVIADDGFIDELMFQAHLIINVTTICLHRPLSTLQFNPVEKISSCAREPSPNDDMNELGIVHTMRVMKSIEAQIHLLALPVRPFWHTPFTTCMVSEGTLALLSACKYSLKGKDLAVARDQIRMTVGCLKALGAIWPRTALNLKQIQTIARHVFQIEEFVIRPSTRTIAHSNAILSSENHTLFGSDAGTLNNEILSTAGSLDVTNAWYGLGALEPEMPWWNSEPAVT